MFRSYLNTFDWMSAFVNPWMCRKNIVVAKKENWECVHKSYQRWGYTKKNAFWTFEIKSRKLFDTEIKDLPTLKLQVLILPLLSQPKIISKINTLNLLFFFKFTFTFWVSSLNFLHVHKLEFIMNSFVTDLQRWYTTIGFESLS